MTAPPQPDAAAALRAIIDNAATEDTRTTAARIDALIVAEMSRPPTRKPGDLDLDLAGGKTLQVRDAECLPNRLIRATLTVRDANGFFVKSLPVVFDRLRDQRIAGEMLNLDPMILAQVHRELREALMVDQSQPSDIPLMRAGDIPETEPAWLILAYLPALCLAVLYGDTATYKTFLALCMAACILTGRDWMGQPTVRGSVIYIAAEGQAGIKRRLRAWEIANGASLAEMLIIPTALDLLDPALHARLLAKIAALDMPPALIIVDTLARNMGGDENNTPDMNGFVAACDQLRTAIGATVLIVHHTNKADTMRGSSVLPAAADVLIRAERTEGAKLVTLTCKKMKDADEFAPVRLRAHVVELGTLDSYGRPVTSLVLRSADQVDPVAPDVRDKPLTQRQQMALNALNSLGGRASASAWERASGLSPSTFYNVIEQLIAARKVQKHTQARRTAYTLTPTPTPTPIPLQLE